MSRDPNPCSSCLRPLYSKARAFRSPRPACLENGHRNRSVGAPLKIYPELETGQMPLETGPSPNQLNPSETKSNFAQISLENSPVAPTKLFSITHTLLETSSPAHVFRCRLTQSNKHNTSRKKTKHSISNCQSQPKAYWPRRATRSVCKNYVAWVGLQ